MVTAVQKANRSFLLFIIINCFGTKLLNATSTNVNAETYEHGSTWSVQRSKRAISDRFLKPVCYEPLGCFPTGGVFFNLLLRPIQLSPQSPGWIGTTFTLHTRQAQPEKIIAGPDLKYSVFDAQKDTKIIVHGFVDSTDDPWMPKMVSRFLSLDDFNVILVDWRRGALPSYSQATSNTRVVGAQIAQLITALQDLKGADAGKFHLIGHSLGAHIMGYAGERINGLGRISGLDPAEPYFEKLDTRVRLDPTDALFVDILHSDGDPVLISAPLGRGGLGIKQPSGHVDFYPNGGENQPGCAKMNVIGGTITSLSIDGIVEGAKLFTACDHLRAFELYINSIAPQPSCRFISYSCANYQDFIDGKCGDCGATGCGIMGYHADKAKPKSGGTFNTYYLQTDSEAPFCLHHYHVIVTVAKGQPAISGSILIELANDDRSTGLLKLNQAATSFQGGREYTFLATSKRGVDVIKSIGLQWQSYAGGKQLLLDSIVVRRVLDDLSEDSAVFPVNVPLFGQILKIDRERMFIGSGGLPS